AHARFGLGYGTKKDLPQGREEFQTASRLNATYLPPYVLIAQTYLADKRTDEAIAPYQAALKVAPDNAVVRETLVMVYMGAGRLTEAINEITVLIKQRPQDPGL